MRRSRFPYYATVTVPALTLAALVAGYITDPHVLPWWGYGLVGVTLLGLAVFAGALIDMFDML